MILYLVEKGVHLDVADALSLEQLEGWVNIFAKREKDKFDAFVKAITISRGL